MASQKIIDYYDQNSESLGQRYELSSFEEIHKSILHFLSPPPKRILDIGAGSGRDAAWFSNYGYQVTAIDPSIKLIEFAKHAHREKIDWKIDRLPKLHTVRKNIFDIVFVNAVFMHLNKKEIEQSLQIIHNLLSNEGLLIVSIKSEKLKDTFLFFDVDITHFTNCCLSLGLKILFQTSESDVYGRQNVTWHRLVFQK